MPREEQKGGHPVGADRGGGLVDPDGAELLGAPPARPPTYRGREVA